MSCQLTLVWFGEPMEMKMDDMHPIPILCSLIAFLHLGPDMIICERVLRPCPPILTFYYMTTPPLPLFIRTPFPVLLFCTFFFLYLISLHLSSRVSLHDEVERVVESIRIGN